MKRVVLFLVALVSIVLGANALAQSRTKVGDGVYLVMYGNKAIIEDDNNQRSISVEIFQKSINRQTSQKIYKVVCGKWTKRVVKDGLKAAIAGGIAASGATGGTSAIISAASTLALYIYDDVCDYYGEKNK